MSNYLPIFLSELAEVYMSGNDYLLKLDQICAEQGTISEDGDAWVDKHSGYFIKKIDFDTEEGFTEEGFKLKTRAILEEDLGNAVLEGTNAGIVETSESKMIKNIIIAFTHSLNIDLSKEFDFIIRNVILLHSENIITKEKYDATVRRSRDKGKTKIATYENIINESYIIFTLIFILIAIQISIPIIKTRTTFPGCIKSFDGFPLFGNDKTALTYIACIANKMKSSVEPWNAISKIKVEGIVRRLEDFIKTYKILKKSTVIERYKEKIQYLKVTKYDLEIDYIENVNLINFLPPLIPFTIPRLTNISPEFKKSLINNITNGVNLQQEQILSIKSKIMQYGLAIQEQIKKLWIKKNH